ncbi:Methyltransferase domain-containing protein [Alteromonadaceae bacterium Bs31]|nr:Methyltransferase domain-containing protein [Alteromonadaceae bacterium Bs31]
MWDKRYAVEQYVYGTEPNDFLREHYTSIAKGKVLCLAEGEGRNAVFLAQQGYQVCAVDASCVARDKALTLAEQKGVTIEYHCVDLSSFDFGVECWQGIVSIFCHLPPSLRKSVHKNLLTALKPSGVMLLEAYTPAQLALGTGGPPVEEMMMTADLLRDELRGLSFQHLQELKRDIQEGQFHCGVGAVVQALGQR